MARVEEGAQFTLGDRVALAREDGFDAGTVRYVGPVKRDDDCFVGVEWDDPSRGKHSGSVVLKDKSTRSLFSVGTPGSGSFVKPEKLLPGISLQEALKEKYGHQIDTGEETQLDYDNRQALANCDDERYVLVSTSSGSPRKQKVLFVEQGKFQRIAGELNRFKLLDVSNSRFVTFEPVAELGQTVSSVQDFGAQRTLLTSWSDVARGCRELVHLRVLDLSGNHMDEVLPSSETFEGAFNSLEQLTLSEISKGWEAAVRLASWGRLPQLRQLRAAMQQLATVSVPGVLTSAAQAAQLFASLQLVDLSFNAIEEWGEVEILAEVPELKTLVVNNNKLRVVSPPASERCWNKLEHLDVACNLIDSWDAAHAMNSFPRLRDVRFTSNPISDRLGQAQTRLGWIARAGGIVTANRSLVRTRERSDSEKLYLRECWRHWQSLSEAERAGSTLGQAYPRFSELAELFGSPGAEDVDHQGESKTIGQTKIEVRIVSMDPDSISKTPLQKTLLGSTKVSVVKLLCQKYFQLPVKNQVLVFRDEGEFPAPLDDDSRSLAYFGVRTKSEILMQRAQI